MHPTKDELEDLMEYLEEKYFWELIKEQYEKNAKLTKEHMV